MITSVVKLESHTACPNHDFSQGSPPGLTRHTDSVFHAVMLVRSGDPKQSAGSKLAAIMRETGAFLEGNGAGI